MPFGPHRGGRDDITATERGFLGKTEDPTTGLVATDHRYYDATIGRFISVDPLADLTDPQTLNPYTYSRNNPTTLIDPSGLAGCTPGEHCNTGRYSPGGDKDPEIRPDLPAYWPPGIPGSGGEGGGSDETGGTRPSGPTKTVIGKTTITAPSRPELEAALRSAFIDVGGPEMFEGCENWDSINCRASKGFASDILQMELARRVCAEHKGWCSNKTCAIDEIIWGVVFGGIANVGRGRSAMRPKAVNLPAWKTINIDMEHILRNHTMQGKGYQQSGIKDKFYDSMSPKGIESTIRQAYRYGTKVGARQGESYLMRGSANGMTIEMWVNVKTGTIKTAYPIGRG